MDMPTTTPTLAQAIAQAADDVELIRWDNGRQWCAKHHDDHPDSQPATLAEASEWVRIGRVRRVLELLDLHIDDPAWQQHLAARYALGTPGPWEDAARAAVRDQSCPSTEPIPPVTPTDSNSGAARLAEILEHSENHEAQALAAGIPALERLAAAAQQHSGQSHHLRRLLLALYNAPEWPFELNRLRALDLELQEDALAVIHLATFSGREIHTHLPNGDDLMAELWEREDGGNHHDQ